MAAREIMSIEEVNAVSDEQFKKIFGNVIEHCPEATHVVIQKRPFTNAEDLKNAFCIYINDLDAIGKTNILRKHPDLADKGCKSEDLTDESRNEQKCAEVATMTGKEKHIFHDFKQAYNKKFQFPFIICARENKVASIIVAIQERLQNSQGIELHNALEEVKKICKLRITDIVR